MEHIDSAELPKITRRGGVLLIAFCHKASMDSSKHNFAEVKGQFKKTFDTAKMFGHFERDKILVNSSK
jgi:hypothetical protein